MLVHPQSACLYPRFREKFFAAALKLGHEVLASSEQLEQPAHVSRLQDALRQSHGVWTSLVCSAKSPVLSAAALGCSKQLTSTSIVK